MADAGSGGGSGGGGGDVGGGSQVDEVAPTLRSTSPASGAAGQALDVPFLVAFSEPMNAATVRAVLYLEHLDDGFTLTSADYGAGALSSPPWTTALPDPSMRSASPST